MPERFAQVAVMAGAAVAFANLSADEGLLQS